MRKPHFIMLVLTLLTAGVSLFANRLSEKYLSTINFTCKLNYDFFHMLLPRFKAMEYVADGLFIISMIFVIIWVIEKGYTVIPRLCLAATAFYTLRAILVTLTPLPHPIAFNYQFGITSYFVPDNGMFPSGHAGITMLVYLFWREKTNNPLLRNIVFLITLAEPIAMLSSRGHYTIDIVGGWLIAWFSYKFVLRKEVQNFLNHPSWKNIF